MLFASFFGRWLDKLGLSARQGIDVVMRQVFFGAGTYHLVDANFEPLPVCMQPHKHHLNAACISAQATLDVEIQVSHFNSAFFFCRLVTIILVPKVSSCFIMGSCIIYAQIQGIYCNCRDAASLHHSRD